MGVMESTYTELALYGSKNECARSDTVFFPISEVCDGTVSLTLLESMNPAVEFYSIIQVEAKFLLRSEANVSNLLFTPKVFIQTYKPSNKQ